MRFLVACADHDDGNSATGGEPSARSEATIRDADGGVIDRLRALGYTDVAEKSSRNRGAGVVFTDATRTNPGVNFYVSSGLCRAEIVDAGGALRHAWSHTPCGRWASAALLPSGDIVAVGQHPPGRLDAGHHRRHLLRLAPDGAVVWERDLPVHHDVSVAPGGRILALTRRERRIPAVHPDIDVHDNAIVVVSAAGDLLEERSLYDLLAAADDVFSFQSVRPRTAHGRTVIDLLHTNTVEWVDSPALAGRDPRWRAPGVLVCLRHQDTIALVDWSSQRVVWAWGRGTLLGPHDARVLPSGNILVFDNGLGRRWSRVVEVDPVAGRMVWEYHAPRPEDLYSRIHGAAQRLLNGNTLIVDSTHGRAFEVTSAGDTVWDFLSPHRDGRGRRYNIVLMRRYEEDSLAPALRSPMARAEPSDR